MRLGTAICPLTCLCVAAALGGCSSDSQNGTRSADENAGGDAGAATEQAGASGVGVGAEAGEAGEAGAAGGLGPGVRIMALVRCRLAHRKSAEQLAPAGTGSTRLAHCCCARRAAAAPDTGACRAECAVRAVLRRPTRQFRARVGACYAAEVGSVHCRLRLG